MSTQNEVQIQLQDMRAKNLKWKDIEIVFSPVPIGTLYKIMHTGKVPKKWWRVLRIKTVRQPRIAISKVDMNKAAYSIVKNISYKNIIELTQHLFKHVLEQKKS